MSWDNLLDDVVKSGTGHLSRADWAERHFLNPTVPYAVKDDPSGEFHKGLQVTTPEGDPITGLRKDDEIPLRLRPYQRDSMNVPRKWRVHRWGRRTGKSFQIGVEVVTEALRDPNAQVLVLAPAENQVKVLFDDYIRPLLRVYRHRRSGKTGIGSDPAEVGDSADFAITKDTQKPQEIVVRGTDGHRSTIRGMVISDSARGQSASFLIMDEADYADTEDIRAIVSPIMMTRPNTRILMVSTPSGQADTYFRNRFDDDDWWNSHQTFEVLPHFDEELWERMAKQAGGENTNTFKQEYLAQWGTATEGVFDQEALNKSFIISPYPRVMEEANRSTFERSPMIAADQTQIPANQLAYYEGIRPMDHNLPGREDPIGSKSVYRPEYRGQGVVTAGTDWNDVAGMQTCIIWWPPKKLLNSGRLEVARYRYDNDSPKTTGRKSGPNGKPEHYVVGSENGDPGGPHDLSQIEGIVIWHGRLESGNFSWQSAANRVASIMAIPRFLDCWYVDKGYGSQVNSMIKKIMATGEWEADMNLLHKARSVDSSALEHMRRFDPEKDPEVTGKKYKPIRFGDPYKHQDIDFSKGEGRYKDVMINLARRMVAGRKLLFPHKEMVGYYKDSELGSRYQQTYDLEAGESKEVATPVTNDDKLRENGADPSRGQEEFGGLITQMQTTKIDGYTPTGRPRYSGDWHAVDGLMLSLLAYWENYAEEGPGNMFRHDGKVPMQREEDVFNAAADATQASRRSQSRSNGYMDGPVNLKSYDQNQDPLGDLINGRKSAEEIGTQMGDFMQQVSDMLQ